jgi:hypothetical protein
MHYDTATFGEKEKPEIVHFYDKKSDIDVMNKLLGQYTTYRK